MFKKNLPAKLSEIFTKYMTKDKFTRYVKDLPFIEKNEDFPNNVLIICDLLNFFDNGDLVYPSLLVEYNDIAFNIKNVILNPVSKSLVYCSDELWDMLGLQHSDDYEYSDILDLVINLTDPDTRDKVWNTCEQIDLTFDEDLFTKHGIDMKNGHNKPINYHIGRFNYTDSYKPDITGVAPLSRVHDLFIPAIYHNDSGMLGYNRKSNMFLTKVISAAIESNGEKIFGWMFHTFEMDTTVTYANNNPYLLSRSISYKDTFIVSCRNEEAYVALYELIANSAPGYPYVFNSISDLEKINDGTLFNVLKLNGKEDPLWNDLIEESISVSLEDI